MRNSESIPSPESEVYNHRFHSITRTVDMLASKINRARNILAAVKAMPKVSITFSNICESNYSTARSLYKLFTKRHRYLIMANKSVGVALVDLQKYTNFENYIDAVGGKNSAAYYSRKAKNREYKFAQINRNDFIEDIHQVNVSAEFRGGRKMTDYFTNRTSEYTDDPAFTYFGVINTEGTLVAYCDVGNFGEFSILDVLLGHKTFLNDGIMYFMITEVIRYLYEFRAEQGCRYLMYDTLLGTNDGLRMFKSKLAFQPYRVEWIWKKK